MLLGDLTRRLPVCAVCKRPVSEVRIWYNPALRLHMVAVRCHGSEEVVGLTDNLLLAHDAVVGVGEAFVGEASGKLSGGGDDLT